MPQASEEMARHEKMPCAMSPLPLGARRVAGLGSSCAGLMPAGSFPLWKMNSQWLFKISSDGGQEGENLALRWIMLTLP